MGIDFVFNHRAETLSLVSEGRTGAARLDAALDTNTFRTSKSALLLKKIPVPLICAHSHLSARAGLEQGVNAPHEHSADWAGPAK